MRSLWFCAFIGIASLGHATAANAFVQPIQWQHCKQFAPTISIPACTAVIQQVSHSSLELADAYRYRGLSYLRAGQYDRAISDQNRSLRLNGQNLAPLLFRGLAFYQKRQYSAALRDFNTAISIDNRFAQAIYARGLVMRSLGNQQAAQENFNLASNINGDVSRHIAEFGVRP